MLRRSLRGKMRMPFASLLFLVHLALKVTAQDLAFVTPNITALQIDSRGWHYYMQGHDVTISWTTPFDQTTLLVFEARDNGTWTFDVLGVDYSSSKTTFTWQAHAIENAGLGNKMYFAIENSKNISCSGCVVKTPGFYVTDVRPAGGSYSSSMSTAASTSTTGAASGQTSPTPTAGGSHRAASSQGSQTAEAASAGNQQSHKSSSSNAVGLGVGLGVGLAVLFALVAFLLICIRRRRQERERFNYRPTGSGNWTQDDTPPNAEMHEAPEQKAMAEINRESGVLGAAGIAGLASQSRYSDLSNMSNPFRPSTAASRMSHASWIEPFDFEKPEARDGDAMNQLRNSAQADSPIQTDSTVRGDSASSNYSEGPEEFGPESPSDAAAVASPSSYNGGMSRQSADISYRPSADMPYQMSGGTDPSSLAGIPERPQPARVADGRNWPLP